MAGTVKVTGLAEAIKALQQVAMRVERATPVAVREGARLVEDRAKENLSRYSHARGTRTPSPPGQPPAKIDGTLRDNWGLDGPVSYGAGSWVCSLHPTTVYAGIQEFGGWTGRNHASYLPERPYLRPAVDDMIRSDALRGEFARLWRAAILA